MTTFEEGNYDDINSWRNGYKWSVNECLQLEREYDLLKMSVPEMALKHKMTHILKPLDKTLLMSKLTS